MNRTAGLHSNIGQFGRTQDRIQSETSRGITVRPNTIDNYEIINDGK